MTHTSKAFPNVCAKVRKDFTFPLASHLQQLFKTSPEYLAALGMLACAHCRSDCSPSSCTDVTRPSAWRRPMNARLAAPQPIAPLHAPLACLCQCISFCLCAALPAFARAIRLRCRGRQPSTRSGLLILARTARVVFLAGQRIVDFQALSCPASPTTTSFNHSVSV